MNVFQIDDRVNVDAFTASKLNLASETGYVTAVYPELGKLGYYDVIFDGADLPRPISGFLLHRG